MRRRVASIALAVLVACSLAIGATAASASPTRIEPRIIGGNNVDATTFHQRWSFIVRLLDVNEPNDAWQAGFCGGSLLGPRTVVTAAHCVTDTTDASCNLNVSRPETAYAGALTLQILAPGSPDLPFGLPGVRTQVTRITVHPAFNGCTLENDVAIIKLASAPPGVQGTDWDAIDLVSVAGGGATDFGDEQWGAGAGNAIDGAHTGDGPWIGGWGDTNANPNVDSMPVTMKQATVPIISDSACTSNFIDPNYPSDNPFSAAHMLCAGTLNAVDTCQGDSGGPLIVWGGNSGGDPNDGSHYDTFVAPAAPSVANYRLAGITSWGFECAGTTYGAYTRVGSYRAWILSTGTLHAGNLTDPASTTLSSPTVKTIRVSWPLSVGGTTPTGYRVYVQDGTNYRVAGTVSASATGLSVGGLHGGRRYRFYVSAVDGAGHESFGSPLAIGTTLKDTVAPRTPGRPTLTGRTRTKLGFAWRASTDNDGVQKYQVMYRPYTARTFKSAGYTVTAKFLRPRLKPGTRYVIRVRAIDYSDHASAWSRTRVMRTLA